MARRSITTDTALAWLKKQRPLPDLSGLVSPLVSSAFTELGVGVAVWHPPFDWNVVHKEKSVIAFETEHGQERLRWPYNQRCFVEVQRTRSPVRGEHAGFHDLFVPVFDASGVCAVLVAGPFLRERPTAAVIVERWFALTRSHATLSDPGFAQYLAATLATLTLEGPLASAFERLMGCFAELASGHGSARALAEEAKSLHAKLLEARSAERMWEVVPSLIDERLARSWAAPDQAQTLWETGLRRLPGPIAVGLMVARTNDADRIDELLRRDAFQRAAVALARKTKGMACGRVGDLGVVLLTDDTGSGSRVRAKLNELAVRVAALGRRLGFKLHFGVALPKDGERLPTRYLVALSAAERALSEDASLIYGAPRPEYSAKHLRKLRQQLAAGVGVGRDLSAKFEQYTQTVLEHCNYRSEPVRIALEAGLERLTEPLLVSGALDEKSFDELWSGLERSVPSEGTVTALVTRYRQLIADIESALAKPAQARRARSMQRALHFMHEHSGEPLSLSRVARIAGFAPDHFSRLFKQSEKTTFESYLSQLRIERARQMLTGTSLNVESISALCGFKNRIHFHRVFKHAFGVTPIRYRAREQYGNRILEDPRTGQLLSEPPTPKEETA